METFFRKSSYESVSGALLGAASVFAVNVFQKRPVYASVHRHVIGAGIGYLIGAAIHWDAERRARINRIYVEDYVRMHPEDFIEPPPKYFKDVFNTWYPNR